ncbi:DmsC/YnfH family molybdoenzyme membrane anchor subunit [Tropicimonas sp. IMCC6043]|uniref:dimethyl sulfoxide reductase anchor subunit family protein n=1 Tax=Tropicimonas sp. IMCC6043 TaxID=2510645 RepID=UPI00101B8694|nr:DmsC/YnfH family molybdoenzyme membrane anchor subunit [Tropicimonas sp. IMCC6043]RYH12219.1 dibenzothiophene desulfurase [Tropicimonas sp. IMCC6043]
MHPAPSVIVFTALSGLGFGLLTWLGLGQPDVLGWAAFGMYFLAYALAVGGLLASAFHLGNPKNAPRAFSQWRTSWLSREAVISVAALLTVAPFAFGRIFLGGAPGWLGLLGAVLCLATVFSTSMIYTQLKTVPRWSQPLTPVLFVAYALAGGALLAGQSTAAGVLLVLLGGTQLAAWHIGDGRFAASGATLETATGLGAIGRVRLLEPPHSGGNYLLREMAFDVGRKHAAKLRVVGLVLAVVLPLLIVLLAPNNLVAIGLAVLLHLTGVFAARWLFFAEAQHVVSLYYGK